MTTRDHDVLASKVSPSTVVDVTRYFMFMIEGARVHQFESRRLTGVGDSDLLILHSYVCLLGYFQVDARR